MKCPNCGEDVKSTDKQCPNCHFDLEKFRNEFFTGQNQYKRHSTKMSEFTWQLIQSI